MLYVLLDGRKRVRLTEVPGRRTNMSALTMVDEVLMCR